MAESDQDNTELPLDGAGTRLRRAREAAGLTLADIAARTRIAERHLKSIEAGNFTALASRAYAVGFARTYARTVDLNEHEVARTVGEEFDGLEPNVERYQPAAFEPGDPARVPAARIAWIAGLSALAVVVAGYLFWRSFYAPAMPLPDIASEAAASPTEAGAPALPAPPAQGPVVFTALEQGIWVRFYDATGTQLLQKEMALGETFAVPGQANGPMIRTARPDALQVTIGGQVVAKLADQQKVISDVPVSAAALLARGQAPVAGPDAPAALPAVAAPPPGAPPAAAATPRREAPKARPAATATRAPVATPTPAPPPAPPAVALPGPAATPQSSTVSQ